MLDTDKTEKALKDFSKYVIQQARTNLTKSKINTSGELYESLGHDLEVSKNSFSLAFNIADYGLYQDQGVSGTKKKFDTPYSYKDKMPPAKAFNQWTVRKRIAPRDENGKFKSRKSIQFAIAKSIYENGIKPKRFLTIPFERAFEKFPNEITEAFGLDIDNFLEHTLNFKQK